MTKTTPTSEAARYLREILSDWLWYELPPSPQDVAAHPERWDGFRTLSPEAKKLLRAVQKNSKLVVRFVAPVKPKPKKGKRDAWCSYCLATEHCGRWRHATKGTGCCAKHSRVAR